MGVGVRWTRTQSVCGGIEKRVYAGVEGDSEVVMLLFRGGAAIYRIPWMGVVKLFEDIVCNLLPRKGLSGANLAGAPSQGDREHPATPRRAPGLSYPPLWCQGHQRVW